MPAIFLSASIPETGQGDYHQSADPALIERAVRALVAAVPPGWRIVWGGHPGLTSLLWNSFQELHKDPDGVAMLYESEFFEDEFPPESAYFSDRTLVEAVPGDRNASLLRLRREMLARKDLTAAVFIGGMEGVEIEHALLRRYRPRARVLLVPASGGAALRLAEWTERYETSEAHELDFAQLFQDGLG